IVAVSVTVAVVLVVRPLWLLLTQSLPRPQRTRLGDGSGSADAADADDANDANDADEPDGPDGPGESDTGRRRNRTSERLSGREVLVLS
ncbi:sodium:proton antiporter, partial [Mycobacterium tuberculosis]|nr:sodium:proton antiporter [Mycobacterium tuberculosis]